MTLGITFLMEIEQEAAATRKCLEKITPELFTWKPHEKSMGMGYLAVIVSEVPKWIETMAVGSEIDFTLFERPEIKTTEALLAYFDANMTAAKTALQSVSDEALNEPFTLKNNGQVLYASPKLSNIRFSINHMIHHRGQLTVYMRLINLAVPSIYGPSADEAN